MAAGVCGNVWFGPYVHSFLGPESLNVADRPFISAGTFGHTGLGTRRARSATGFAADGKEDDCGAEEHDGEGEKGVIERLSSEDRSRHRGD
jgi:hypothetical protein